MAILRELATSLRDIDKSTPFVAAQFDSAKLWEVVTHNYPDVARQTIPPPTTPIDLDQITSAEQRELSSLPRAQRRALAKEVTDAVSKAMDCGALKRTPIAKILHCAPLFAVWQRVKWRLIYDLRMFNLFSNDPAFHMETIADVPNIARGCKVGGKIDLKSAYWQVPLGDALRRYMGCSIGNDFLAWQVLPFGLAMAPRLFTEIMRPLLLAWRSIGIRVLVYLDDIAIFANDVDTYAKHTAIVLRDLQASGLRVASDKAFLAPHSRFELLGMMVDLDEQAFSISPERASRIADDAREILDADSPTSLSCAGLLGRIAFAGIACPWIAYYRASLTADVATASNPNFDPHAVVTLSDDSKRELLWWINDSKDVITRNWRWATTAATTVFSKRGSSTPIPQFEAASDASDTGVGLRFGIRGCPVIDEPLPDWLPPTAPSAARELYGLARLVEVGQFPPRSTVRLIVDAQAAVGTWLGASVTPLTARAARRLFVAVAEADITAFIDWLPREELFDVDAGSRKAAADLAHAMVDPAWLRHVFLKTFGVITADAEFFASSRNRAFPSSPCGSRRPDPDALLGDGVSSPAWRDAERGWAFPPFALAKPVIAQANSLSKPPNVLILLPTSSIHALRGFSTLPGPPHLLAPPNFTRRIQPPVPLTLCIPAHLASTAHQ